MEFNVKSRLPSGQIVRIPELKNKDFFTILKFCENEDYEGLSSFLNHTTLKGLEYLDIIDKFYILLLMRMLYIDPEIMFEDKNKCTITYTIQDMLEKINLFERDYEKIYDINQFKIELGLPNTLYFEGVNDIYLSTIKHIHLYDKHIDFSVLNEEEKELILSNIPNTIFTVIKNYIATLSENLKCFVIVDANDDFDIEEINLNILSNGIISFILGIYSTGLSNFFQLMYQFTNKIGFTSSDFFNLTPLDSRVIFNIYQKELSEKEKNAELITDDSE